MAVSKDPHYVNKYEFVIIKINLIFLQSLKLLYGKILRDLKKIPETSAYRKYTEDVINSRLQHVESVRDHTNIIYFIYDFFVIQEPNIARLERKINCGQIEEVIVQVNPSFFNKSK